MSRSPGLGPDNRFRSVPTPWWVSAPELWQAELDSFATWRVSVAAVVDVPVECIRVVELELDATCALLVDSRMESATVKLAVRYPRLYPHAAPEVRDGDGSLAWAEAHRTADGLLHLAPPRLWDSRDTVGELLARQFPLWLFAADGELRAGVAAEQRASLEDVTSNSRES